MHINQVNNAQPNFQAHVSNKFLKAADNYFSHIDNRIDRGAFCDKVREVEKWGSPDMIIDFIKGTKSNKKFHRLFVKNDNIDGFEDKILTEKDALRKVITKFIHMNEYEFNLKTK